MRDTTEPFDAAQDLKDAPHTGARMRPTDAATLIVTRRAGGRTEVLMGRRAAGHVFMASKWVFPGGRIDPSDFRIEAAGDLPKPSQALLTREMPARRARALALTAIRETFEETGLRLARPAPPASIAGPWRGFRAVGALPDLSALTYIARAITPPGRTRRFDARFFMASAEALLDVPAARPTEELDTVAWIPLDEAKALDLPAITRFVLNEAAERLITQKRPLPYVRQLHGRHRVEYLETPLSLMKTRS